MLTLISYMKYHVQVNQLTRLTSQEYARQRDTLNLIASENYPSPRVLALLGSVWQNKYAEGVPGKRYYAGNQLADRMESYVQELALRAFDPTGEYGVNAQVLSGSPANASVYLAMLEAGDTIMSLNLANGGHLSHLHQTSNYLKFFKLVNYDVTEVGPSNFEIDVDDYRAKLKAANPKLVIVGFSAYPRAYQFAELCRLAHEAGAMVLADIAHIAGLIAAGLHDSPFKSGADGADFVTTTTHKTLRGPRNALLFGRQEYMPVLNRTIFPGTSGGPHLHQIAAVGQCLLEVLGEDSYPDKVPFKAYAQNIIETCKALETSLGDHGLTIISPTQNHLCLVKLPDDTDSLETQRALESAGIITNRNMIPFDTKPAWRPSGLRLGTAALASRGLTSAQAAQLGELIADVVLKHGSAKQITHSVQALAADLNWWYRLEAS
jgi:glycine hydroxymethyltransferase